MSAFWWSNSRSWSISLKFNPPFKIYRVHFDVITTQNVPYKFIIIIFFCQMNTRNMPADISRYTDSCEYPSGFIEKVFYYCCKLWTTHCLKPMGFLLQRPRNLLTPQVSIRAEPSLLSLLSPKAMLLSTLTHRLKPVGLRLPFFRIVWLIIAWICDIVKEI